MFLDNAVPSQTGDSLEGVTSRSYGLFEIMKTIGGGRNSHL